MNKQLTTDVFETLGAASMCWSEAPKGIFDSTLAEKFGNELLDKIKGNIPAAMDVIVNALKTDEGYRIGWKANIAMAFYDTYCSHHSDNVDKKIIQIANEAAENFLNLLTADVAEAENKN